MTGRVTVRLDVYPQSTTAASDELVCVVVFLFPQGRSHFRVVLALLELPIHRHFVVLLWRACWMGWICRRLQVREYGVDKVCASLLWWSRCCSFFGEPLKVGWRGLVCRKKHSGWVSAS